MSLEIEIRKSLRIVPNFPKDGINFMDITTLINNGKLFSKLINHLYERYKDSHIDYIAGIDSRGFIFGTPLAIKLGIGFVPVRKKGKLPAETFKVSYDLEYGSDTLEIHKDAFQNKKKARVLMVDDLLATGGTAEASLKLIEMTGAEVVESFFLINLKFLNGESKLRSKIYSIVDEV